MAKKEQKKTTTVKVKSIGEVVATLQRHMAYNLHGRYAFRLSDKTQQKIVSYGPWLSIVLVLFILPELFIFAKTGTLMHLTGFFNEIVFNRDAWVILLLLLTNILLLVDGISELFEKRQKGWQRIYLATLLSTIYIIWQLLSNLTQPAAPLLSLVAIVSILFTLFDIAAYYKK